MRKQLEVKFKKQLEDFMLAQSPKTPKATHDMQNTSGRTSGYKSTPRGTRDKTLDAADVGTLRLPGGALSTPRRSCDSSVPSVRKPRRSAR